MVAKPIVKWAGGKGSLTKTLEQFLPKNFTSHSVTYIEPFVGGGAMLFYMLQKYPNIKKAIINDVNKDLMHCFHLIKVCPKVLITELSILEKNYYSIETKEGRKEYFYAVRDIYNNGNLDANLHAAYFVFLNRTCFNGLYRENRQGKFNVPFGRYEHPIICNADLIMENHKHLKKVEIFCGDYTDIIRHLGRGYNFVYFDPPYRPLLGASNFKEYCRGEFGDNQQRELKNMCDKLNQRGCQFMLSNSDSRNEDGTSFFEQLYDEYNFNNSIMAPRVINAFAARRQREREVLIRNYE